MKNRPKSCRSRAQGIRLQRFPFQMQQIKKMGGMGSIPSMMPMGSQLAGVDMMKASVSMHRVESIILSMTKEERANPGLMNPSASSVLQRRWCGHCS